MAFSLEWVGFPGGLDGKESACGAGNLGWEDPLDEAMATHSSLLGWRIPWTEEPGGLQSIELQRVRHDCLSTGMGETIEYLQRRE